MNTLKRQTQSIGFSNSTLFSEFIAQILMEADGYSG